jgi:hypothetical protein
MAVAARLARELLLAREGELRQPRPAEDVGARQEPFDHRPHGGGAEHQRLLAAAPVEHAVGETWPRSRSAPSWISSIATKRRRDRAAWPRRWHPVARVLRLDLLLAGDQRDVLGAHPVDDLVVDLARQEPQR